MLMKTWRISICNWEMNLIQHEWYNRSSYHLFTPRTMDDHIDTAINHVIRDNL